VIYLISYVKQIGSHEVIICILAAQFANLGESIIGASFQEKEGFRWVRSRKTDLFFV